MKCGKNMNLCYLYSIKRTGSAFRRQVYGRMEACDSKVTSTGALHAEKIAEAVLLYVFKIFIPNPSYVNCSTSTKAPY